jgi:hypothetical protein
MRKSHGEDVPLSLSVHHRHRASLPSFRPTNLENLADFTFWEHVGEGTHVPFPIPKLQRALIPRFILHNPVHPKDD